MLQFTTDTVAPRDRFDHWREARGKALFGVTIELEREKRLGFRGRFKAETIGDAVVSEMQASAYHVSRTKQDIARFTNDSLLIGWQVQGGGWMETPRGIGAQPVRDGILTVGHSEQPYSAAPRDNKDFIYRLLKIPLADSRFSAIRLSGLAAIPIGERSTFLRPMGALFSAIANHDAALTDPGAGVDAIGHLALVAAGQLAHHEPESRAALRLAMFHQALAILRRDLKQQGLSPALVAQELGVSPRQVHLLFEPSGRSLAKTLATLRVQHAVTLLREQPERTIAGIAYASGFDSLATFYRAFRAVHGMAPLDMRMMQPRS